MNKSELRNIHERVAVRLRRLIASATTPALKARLIEEAEKHEELAEQLEHFKSATESKPDRLGHPSQRQSRRIRQIGP